MDGSNTTKRHAMANYILPCHCQTKVLLRDIQKHPKPHHFHHKRLSHLPLVSGFFEATFRSALSSLEAGSSHKTLNVFNQQHIKELQFHSCLAVHFFFFFGEVTGPNSVPESAELKLSHSLSRLRFRLHLAEPDLKVAVVLIRCKPAFSGPKGQSHRKHYHSYVFIHQQKQQTEAQDVLRLMFLCVTEQRHL